MDQCIKNQIAFDAALRSTYVVKPPPGQEGAVFDKHFAIVSLAIETYEAIRYREMPQQAPSRN
jgi:hypothetical protein